MFCVFANWGMLDIRTIQIYCKRKKSLANIILPTIVFRFIAWVFMSFKQPFLDIKYLAVSR